MLLFFSSDGAGVAGGLVAGGERGSMLLRASIVSQNAVSFGVGMSNINDLTKREAFAAVLDSGASVAAMRERVAFLKTRVMYAKAEDIARCVSSLCPKHNSDAAYLVALSMLQNGGPCSPSMVIDVLNLAVKNGEAGYDS